MTEFEEKQLKYMRKQDERERMKYNATVVAGFIPIIIVVFFVYIFIKIFN